MKINGKTSIYAVIGHPISHTLSPAIHNAAFAKVNLNAAYVAFDVLPANLWKAVEGFKSLGVKGFNVTTPHKLSIISFLDRLDSIAERISAVNTVKNVNGELQGYNTDGEGVLGVFQHENIPLKGSKIVIIGAGGAAKAISHALASEAGELVILNRTEKRAIQLAESLSKYYSSLIKSKQFTRRTVSEELSNAQVLINATSVGAHPNTDESVVDKECITEKLTVLDIVYNPLKTRLLRDAESKGAKTLNGLSMLVHQAIKSFKIWTGIEIEPSIMFQAVEKELEQIL